MNAKQTNACKIVAMILEKTSYLIGVLFITIPLLILILSKGGNSDLINIIIFISLWFALIMFFRAWHIFIDAKFFHLFTDKKMTLKEVDAFLISIFDRKILEGKTVQYRIDASVKLMRRFFFLLFMHIITFIIPLFTFLIDYADLPLF